MQANVPPRLAIGSNAGGSIGWHGVHRSLAAEVDKFKISQSTSRIYSLVLNMQHTPCRTPHQRETEKHPAWQVRHAPCGMFFMNDNPMPFP
jgi:hypothetical protein